MISEMTIVHHFVVAALYHWPLHQWDIKNTFLWWFGGTFTWGNLLVLLIKES